MSHVNLSVHTRRPPSSSSCTSTFTFISPPVNATPVATVATAAVSTWHAATTTPPIALDAILPFPSSGCSTLKAERRKLLDRQRRMEFKLQLQSLARIVAEALSPPPPTPSSSSASSITQPCLAVIPLTSHVEIINAACSVIQKLTLEKHILRESIDRATERNESTMEEENEEMEQEEQEEEDEHEDREVQEKVDPNECSFCTAQYRNIPSAESSAAIDSSSSLLPHQPSFSFDGDELFRSFLFTAGGVCALLLGPDDSILDVNELFWVTCGLEAKDIVGTKCEDKPLSCKFFYIPTEFETPLLSNASLATSTNTSDQEAIVHTSSSLEQKLLASSSASLAASSTCPNSSVSVLSLFADRTIAEAPILPEALLQPILPMITDSALNRPSNSIPLSTFACMQVSNLPPLSPHVTSVTSPSSFFALSPNFSVAAASETHLPSSDSAFLQPAIPPTLSPPQPPPLATRIGRLSPSLSTPSNNAAAASFVGGSLHRALLQLTRSSSPSRILCRQMTAWGEILESIMIVTFVKIANAANEKLDQPPSLVLLSTPNSRRLLTIVTSSSETNTN